MKKLLLLQIVFANFCLAQNLVPNPSFEDFTTCVDGVEQVYKATGWHSYRWTPDYFNACDTVDSLFTVPYNGFGYRCRIQECILRLYSYGNPFGDPNYREILGVQLITPLSINTNYYVSFFVNRSYGTYYPTRMSSNNLGAFLSTVLLILLVAPAPISNFAHIYSSSIITDTLGWTHNFRIIHCRFCL
jgi:hypothetical protein